MPSRARTLALCLLPVPLLAWLGFFSHRTQAEPAPAAADDLRAAVQLRRPLALALVQEGKLLLAANRDSGTLSLIDTGSFQVAAERPIGARISDMATVPGTNWVLATDEKRHELRLLELRGDDVRLLAALEVPPYPVQVRVDGKRAYVASLWPRTVCVVEIEPSAVADQPPALKLAAMTPLPFAPRMLLPVPSRGRLVAADSHGGKLAVLDAATGKLLHVRELPGHNIRGLALSADGKKLLVAHQILNDLAETTNNDVHWGVLMSNVLRWVPLENVLSTEGELLRNSHVHLTGDFSDAGGDPGGVAVAPGGMAVIALSGVNQVGLGHERDFGLERINIGQRPVAVAVSPDGATAYVANMFGDSISRIDLQNSMLAGQLSLGKAPELTPVQQGEVLFYNARLALDGWMSCHSCHTDGHTNGQLNDNLSDGAFGAPKRVLSLLGVRDTAPYAWRGHVRELTGQIRSSIDNTMQGRRRSETEIQALAAYLETLEFPPTPAELGQKQDGAAVARGAVLFNSLGCAACHKPPTYTSADVYDVGLTDKHGNRKYNPPPLRGVGQRGPYFHDNRAATLEDVFRTHRHQLEMELPAGDLADLLSFLRSL